MPRSGPSAPREAVLHDDSHTDITSELTVYRYSEDKGTGYHQAKVSWLPV